MWDFISADSFPSILEIIQKGGTIAILLFIIWSGSKKNPIWVFGWTYRDEIERHEKTIEEKDNWKDLAMRGTRIAETAVSASTGSDDRK